MYLPRIDGHKATNFQGKTEVKAKIEEEVAASRKFRRDSFDRKHFCPEKAGVPLVGCCTVHCARWHCMESDDQQTQKNACVTTIDVDFFHRAGKSTASEFKQIRGESKGGGSSVLCTAAPPCP